MNGELIIAIVGSIVGSSALFGFIQFLVSRKDKKDEKFDKLQESIDSLTEDVDEVKQNMSSIEIQRKADMDALNDKIDKNGAVQARIRILRANDEMRQDVHHSYEYFRQLHQDITDYENYCKTHPDFKNNEAVNSIEYINRVYQDCLDKHNFLT